MLTDQNSASPFDLSPGQGQRSATFRFDLISADTGQVLGQLTPIANSTPSLSHDTSSTIKRQLSLDLGVVDTAAIDTIHDRVRVSMILANGSTYPLGRYMFTDNTRVRYTSGLLSSTSLCDEAFILDQPNQAAFPNATLSPIDPSGTTTIVNYGVTTLIEQLLATYPMFHISVDPSSFFTTNTWAFGTTNAQILEDLAALGDYFPPWFGNDEAFHMIRSFDPADVVPDFDWDTYSHVIADSITESDDLLLAPNRIIVVSNSVNTITATTPIIGVYDIPISAPHSIKNRGFVVPEILQIQMDTQAQATAIARNIGIQSTVYQRTSLATIPDPRHDSYNVIRWLGVNWLELAWSMELIEGGSMSHTLRKTYS
jgi:hypothetical protein